MKRNGWTDGVAAGHFPDPDLSSVAPSAKEDHTLCLPDPAEPTDSFAGPLPRVLSADDYGEDYDSRNRFLQPNCKLQGLTPTVSTRAVAARC